MNLPILKDMDQTPGNGFVMIETDQVEDKRCFPRHDVEFTALLKIGILLQGRARIKNVSLNGILLESPAALANVRVNRIPEMIGTSIKIVFPSESLTVQGKIVRINQKKGEIALRVVDTTNSETWERICSEESSC